MKSDKPSHTGELNTGVELLPKSGINGLSSSGAKKEDEGKREKWSRKIDFLFTCVGYGVGLGNVWRFPYLCYKNGGGAFLVPYFTCVALVGVPMVFLEVAAGQFMSAGAIDVWNMCPLFEGIGYASMVMVIVPIIYGVVVLAWTFFYLVSSFTSDLPWASCNNTWNTDRCFSGSMSQIALNSINGSNFYLNLSDENLQNSSSYTVVGNSDPSGNYTDPATEFWERKALQISSGIEDAGHVRWELALCLVLAWAVTYFAIWKGLKLSGKVMYFTATSPYVFLLVLLVRGATLPGALGGIKFYIIPEWSKLANLQVWSEACTQIFYSYGLVSGAMTTLGSFNDWNHNCWRDSIIMCCINSATSFLAGFVVFTVLGFMSFQQGVHISQVAESGPGLAFIIYPTAVSQMPLAPLWSVLFFTMLVLLGIDTQIVATECFMSVVADKFPKYLRGGKKREISLAVACSIFTLLGLCMVTNGGIYVFQLFDYYAANKLNIIIAVMECLVIVWIYGVNRFYDNIRMMVGFRPNPYMKLSWLGPTPIILLAVLVMCIYTYSEVRYNRTYVYPGWAVALGWTLACSSIVWIPIVAIIKVVMAKGTVMERIKNLTRPRLRAHQMRPSDDPRDLIREPNDHNGMTSHLNPDTNANTDGTTKALKSEMF